MKVRDRIQGLRRVRASELLPHPLNWRVHPERQQNAMLGILADIGIADAVIARELPSGELQLIDGHLRADLMPETKIPVLVVDLDENEAAKLLAVHDPVATLAETDVEQLTEVLRSVRMSNKELEEMVGELVSTGEVEDTGEVEEDQLPEPSDELLAKWKVERGQVWKVGRHRISCGDSVAAEVVGRLMGEKEAESIIADPPYGMRLNADFSGMKNKLEITKATKLKGGTKYANVTGDHQDFSAKEVIQAFRNPPVQFWFGADYYASTLPDTEHSGSWLVWDKRLDDSADRMFGSCFELIWSKCRCKRDILRVKWAGIFGMENEPDRGRKHPNQKPVALMSLLIQRTDGLVVDPFLGSGSTMVAAEQLNRTCYGIEIEPRYVAVALERMATLGVTGTKTGE